MHSPTKRTIVSSIMALSLFTLSACGSSSSPSGNQTTGQSSLMPPEAAQQTSGNDEQTLSELLSDRRPRQCTVTFENEGTAVEATYYISGGKMRSEYAMKLGGQPTKAYAIMKDEVLYSWFDGGTGYKGRATDEGQSSSAGQANATGPTPEMDQKLLYRCSAWSGDPSMFDLPKGIDFMDMDTR